MAKSTIAYKNKNNSFEKFLSWTNEKEVLAEEIHKLIKSSDQSLLDVGAGNGQLTSLISHKLTHTTAIEPSKSLYVELNKNLPKAQKLNLSLEEFEAEYKYDFILISHVFHYLENPELMIGKMINMLNPGGRILAIMLDNNSGHMKYINKFKNEVYEGKGDPDEFRWKDLIHILDHKKINYSVTDITTEIVAPSIEDFIAINDFHFNTDTSNLSQGLTSKMKLYLKDYVSEDKVVVDVLHKFILINK